MMVLSRGADRLADVHREAEALGDGLDGLLLHRREIGVGVRRGRGPVVGEGVEAFERVVDGLGELERIQALLERHELGDLHGIGFRARPPSLQGRLRAVVDPAHARAHPDFLDELDRGEKEVLEEPELVTVEVVHRVEGLGGVVADVAQELPDVGPVLLLDVGVVVFLIGPAARERDLVGLTGPRELVIDALRAVVGVDPLEGKGQGGADLLQGGPDAGLGFAQDGPGLAPGGVDVREGEGVDEFPVGALAGMGHEVHLGEAGDGHGPPVRPEGDVVVQEGAGCGAPVEAAREPSLGGLQPSVHLPGAEGEPLLVERGREGEASAGPGHPEGQQGLEAHRPGIPSRLPDRPQGPDDLRSVVGVRWRRGRRAGAGGGPVRSRRADFRWEPVTAQHSSRIRRLSSCGACR